MIAAGDMKRVVLGILTLCLHLALACTDGLEGKSEASAEECVVRFEFGYVAGSRGYICPDESALNDFNIYVYSRGALVNSVYVAGGRAETSMTLNSGVSYNIYVLANVGEVEPYGMEDDLLHRYVLSLSDMTDVEEFLPLSGSACGVVVSGQEQKLPIMLRRLSSKILFSLDKSALGGLEVCSVRLCQSAACVRPFMTGGSAVMSADEVFDGDYCVEAELAALNEGGQVQLYAMENCQGILLPGNDDPWSKVPAAMDDMAELCTFLEVSCRFDEIGIYDGEVIYRLYLGEDNCTDFNLKGNSVLKVNLSLTVDGLKHDVTWRVEPDYVIRDGYASGWISKGRHSEDDLYVGEKFEYSLLLSDEIQEYIGADMDSCEVFFRSSVAGQEGAVDFSDLIGSDGHWYVKALCLRPAQGEICMREKDGKFLAVLSENVCVKPPGVVLSDKPCCAINGGSQVCSVYLVDSEQVNLNVSDGCGYDLGVFDFDLQPQMTGNASVLSTVDFTTVCGESGTGGPALSFEISCAHDGADHNVNMTLLSAIQREDCLGWVFSEQVCGLRTAMSADLKSLPVELTLVDNDWAGYGETQLAMIVDNPSMIPLDVLYWQFVTVDAYCDVGLKDFAEEKVSNDILLLPMEYVVNQYNDSSLPVYGSSFSFVSERNGYGSNATEDGSRLVYDLEGVDTYDLLAALTYDGWGYESMSHHVQATFSDGVPIEDLTVNDCLSDGSEEFRQKYDESGLNDRGVWLYEGRTCVLAPEDTFSMYPGLNPQNVKGMKSQISVIANMTYDMEASRVYVVASDIGSAGLEVSTLTEAKADGYVQTFPDGTWGKAVDNNCHEEIICEDNSVTVRNIESKEIADGDAVRNVFEQIYRNTYYDSWNKVGSANNYWHSAHPTSLDVKMSFKLSDVNDKSAQLFKPLFPAYVYYWHAQEAVRYRVPVNFSYSTFKFVEVQDT